MKTQLSCLLVDDEWHARELLKTLLNENCNEVTIIGEAESVSDAIEKIKELKPDLVFLDIKLKNKTAFDLLDAIEETNFQTIFTTAYSEYAIKAFDYFAVHYLLKPINIEHLEIAVKRALNRYNNNEHNDHKQLSKDFKEIEEQKIALPSRSGDEFVYIKDILCCTASGSYTEITFKKGKNVLISKPLGYFEKKLSPTLFIRTHKKYLVNLLEVVSMERGRTPILTLTGDVKVDVSLTYKSVVKEKLGDRIVF
jgi:two-component system LytT family response regulator